MDLRRAPWWRKLVVLTLPAMATATVVLVAGVEIWVRVSWDPTRGTPGFFLPDPVRGQRLAADYTGWFAGVPVHINSLELRDAREYDLAKSPSTFRILVLGDSVTFGHGSVYEHTYPYLVEQKLRAWRPDIDWQIWNAAVPGYNTSQELAQLLEIGPRVQPDLVVVGFFENDLIGNGTSTTGWWKTAIYGGLSWARRHVYSLELYRRLYLQLAWRFSASNELRLRVEHLGTEEEIISAATNASALKGQTLTPFDRLTDEQASRVRCADGMKPNPETIPAIQRDPGYAAWLQAVRGFQQLTRTGQYRILFFLNIVPPICPDGDVFYDGGTEAINDFYLRITSEGTPAVSSYDAFRRVHPSQMPNATAHTIGNSNMVKAEVMFSYLRDEVLGELIPSGRRSEETSPGPR